MQSIFKVSDGIPFTPTFGTGGDPLGLNSSDDWDYPNRLLRENILDFLECFVGVQVLAVNGCHHGNYRREQKRKVRSLSSASTTMYSPRPRRAVEPI